MTILQAFPEFTVKIRDIGGLPRVNGTLLAASLGYSIHRWLYSSLGELYCKEFSKQSGIAEDQLIFYEEGAWMPVELGFIMWHCFPERLSKDLLRVSFDPATTPKETLFKMDCIVEANVATVLKNWHSTGGKVIKMSDYFGS